MCWGREDRGIQDNLIKGSVRLLVLYNRIALCPFQGCLSASPGQEGGSGMSGYSKVKGVQCRMWEQRVLGLSAEDPSGKRIDLILF